MEDQQQSKLQEKISPKKEADLKELILVIQGLLKFLVRKWKIIIPVMIVGAILGGLYAKSKKLIYSATSVFVLENGQSSGGVGGLSLLGFGGKSNSGLFDETDNIVWLYKSQSMIQKSLLSVGKKGDKDIVMIEWFLNASGLRGKLRKTSPSLASLKFNTNDDFSNLSIEQNSLIGLCTGEILNKCLNISKIEKTENIISVNIKSEDEIFAKTFDEILVNTVNSFYIQTKTLKAAHEVFILEQKLDSFRTKMNIAMQQVAVATDNVPYANPNQQVLRVNPQKKAVEAQIESAMYTEVAKNLELSKMDLAKITPLIKVIEAPQLPLGGSKPVFSKMLIAGSVIGAILAIGALSMIYFYKKIMA